MRLYMVRRTRTFIQDNYAELDTENGRKYLTFEDGSRSYFPNVSRELSRSALMRRIPATSMRACLARPVVDAVNRLFLPRYGLGNYVAPKPHAPPTANEAKLLDDLSRAGKRLMGFCRTNLFKRLESSGDAFQQSLERHILRNYVFLHAIEKGLPLPIGTQDAGLLDAANYDEDVDDQSADAELFAEGEDETTQESTALNLRDEAAFRRAAAETYDLYAAKLRKRFKWLRPDLFVGLLAKDLTSDSASLIKILRTMATGTQRGMRSSMPWLNCSARGIRTRKFSSSPSLRTPFAILRHS